MGKGGDLLCCRYNEFSCLRIEGCSAAFGRVATRIKLTSVDAGFFRSTFARVEFDGIPARTHWLPGLIAGSVPCLENASVFRLPVCAFEVIFTVAIEHANTWIIEKVCSHHTSAGVGDLLLPEIHRLLSRDRQLSFAHRILLSLTLGIAGRHWIGGFFLEPKAGLRFRSG